MVGASTSARTITTGSGSDRLQHLVDRIAAGDRTAFRRLYRSMAIRVWIDTVQALPNPADARAVTRSTFLEVWRLARHHNDDSPTDPVAWIGTIIARRVDERLRAMQTPSLVLGDHDRLVHCELVALLGAGADLDTSRQPSTVV